MSRTRQQHYYDTHKAKFKQNATNWRLANLDQYAESRRKSHLFRKYKLTIEDYNELLEKQNNVCAICKKVEDVKQGQKIIKLAVDHNHITGKIRGLLCVKCNVAVGRVEMYLNEVIQYLEN